MNKLYKTLDLYAAWLVEINSQYNSLSGIKNIIGIKVIYNGENLFYSILDDCFFYVFPHNISNENKWKNFNGRIFVQIYEYQKPPFEIKTFGMELYNYIKKDYITKQELIESKKNMDWLFGYQSDFDCESLKMDTLVDYENLLTIEENIIDTIQKYEEKRKTIMFYENTRIYDSSVVKRLNKKN